ncbi:MAG: GTP cyclohydrolase II RibA [Saprospiraceae bacterium]
MWRKQLERSKEIIAEQHGILIYLRQEGRGIGLIKKLEAYNFQDDGADTVDANLMLGFHSDEREYTDAIEILKDLKIKEIILLTNNPDKLNAFDNTGIKLVKREPLIMDANSLNKRYIDTKKEKMGHLI